MVDKPLGPRQPDKRHAAYESIFGRPGAQHQLGPHPAQPGFNYPQGLPLQSNGQPYYVSQNSLYQPTLERRPSHNASLSQPQYLGSPMHLQGPTNTYRQTYYPGHHPQQPHALQQPAYAPPHIQPMYMNSQTLGPPSMVSRARSIASNPHAPGIIAPHPEEPPDATLIALQQQGLTPAQAYQAQVYLNSPNMQPPQQQQQQMDWARYSTAPGPPHRNSYPQPGPSGGIPAAEIPKLGINLDNEDGKLNIDFGGGSPNGSGSDQGTDEGSSELPWVKKDRVTPVKGPRAAKTPANRLSSQSLNANRPYPPQIDTTLPSPTTRSSVASMSPDSTLNPERTTLTSRRSSESHRNSVKATTKRSTQDRSMSMSAASSSTIRAATDGGNRSSRPPIPPSLHDGRNSPASIRPNHRRTPVVYPALLSRVAEAFRERIPLADRVKDGLTYKEAFDGREAVDKIAYIIKTTDRNLALLLGRALDAQKFFHDVTYDHRLRDSANELYQFPTKLPSPFVSGELANGNTSIADGEDSLISPRPSIARHNSSVGTASVLSSTLAPSSIASPAASPIQENSEFNRPRKGSITADDIPLPSGVFTLLTDCYSPTCTRDQLCYSIACPRRLEQQARLNMKPQPGLKKEMSRESLGDDTEPGTLWIHSVSQEIVNSVSDSEKKRQEAINEVIYTERDFVRDMEYLRDQWINQLKESDIIPISRRTDFLEQVFWNIHDIISVNTRLREALNKRQRSYAIVDQIGDIFLEIVPHFGPFVSYGAHQLYGKLEFEKEKGSNPAFSQFVDATERLPESRKLELNAYLTKPTTRLARYPLLLEAVLKHTPDDSPDKTTLPKVVALVREFLAKVNVETGKTENRFNLVNLDQQLVFRQGEEVDLRLKEEGRQLIFKGALNKRGGAQGDSGDLQVYLFDHALLLTKLQKNKHGHDTFKVYRKPIPLELLLVAIGDEAPAHTRPGNRARPVVLPHVNGHHNRTVGPGGVLRPDGKNQFSITFVHLGRKYYQLTLWASTYVSQRKWLEHIVKQQEEMWERSMIFDTVTLNEGFFHGPNKVNCAAPFDNGRKIVYGTDDGVYISDLRDTKKDPSKVLALAEVLQVDVLEDYQLLIVLSERQVITFPLEALDPHDPMAGIKRAKRISSHTSFFKAGFCLGKVLVCVVKSSPLSSTFKTLEPIEQSIRGRAKPTFKKLLQGGNDTLKMFREFYIPVESTSIHYLKTKMCVGCSKGFEIVDLETLDTQGLLDPNDEALEFVRRRENARPMAIYRIENEFLLCYDEFAFYVNKNGRRSRKEFMVHWEGTPTGFALHQPYVLAFEPTFVEIRHIETGLLSQVIQGNNLRLLFADTPPSTTNSSFMAYGGGYDYNHPQMGGRAGFGHPMQGYSPYARNPQGVGREEIVMVSDDRVLTLKTVHGTDGMSIRSGVR